MSYPKLQPILTLTSSIIVEYNVYKDTIMAIARENRILGRLADKAALLALLDKIDAANGHIRRKGLPAKQLRDLMIGQGVNPDANMASRELHRMKYGEDE